MFIDPKTMSKLVFISGDISEGSENDQTLRDIIGLCQVEARRIASDGVNLQVIHGEI